jgi:hypothetical protein
MPNAQRHASGGGLRPERFPNSLIGVALNVPAKYLCAGRRTRRESGPCRQYSVTESARRASCSGRLWRVLGGKQRTSGIDDPDVNERVAVVATLLPGSRERAAQICRIFTGRLLVMKPSGGTLEARCWCRRSEAFCGHSW